jgi:hypothetical protein
LAYKQRGVIFSAELKSQRSGNGAESGPQENIRRQLCCLLLDASRNWALSMLLAWFSFRVGIKKILGQGDGFLSQLWESNNVSDAYNLLRRKV